MVNLSFSLSVLLFCKHCHLFDGLTLTTCGRQFYLVVLRAASWCNEYSTWRSTFPRWLSWESRQANGRCGRLLLECPAKLEIISSYRLDFFFFPTRSRLPFRAEFTRVYITSIHAAAGLLDQHSATPHPCCYMIAACLFNFLRTISRDRLTSCNWIM